MSDAERERLEGADEAAPWKRWGPYLAERAWGTVREDYSDNGDAWNYFPHDHARSRAYRWNEDGLGGICDDHQILCFALAFHNGEDPILKERAFGLTNPQGNHGEDAKDYWFYLDSTPTHSWMRWSYMYPQSEFPYGDLIETNARRNRLEPEYELVDTGAFDANRSWAITADYAKASTEDILIKITVRNLGPEEATIDVLPTLWFRNTWSWGLDDRKPSLKAEDGRIVAQHHSLGRRYFAGDGTPEMLFCENETNSMRLWGRENQTPYPKDGINDYVVNGAATVNPAKVGTKVALRYHLTVAPGGTAEIKVRLTDDFPEIGADFDSIMEARQKEADDFYAAMTPRRATDDEALVMRQAFGGMLWGKQFFHYDIERWLNGDPVGPQPPENRKHARNARWRHIDNFDVVSMPDKWEYPWYAVWDLAFHCVPLAHVDPEFAKDQLLLFLREWYQHPAGDIPAYEWNFSDVNPPVHAWACLKVFEIDGSADYAFLGRAFHKLLLNFTWWTNQKDHDGNNVFEGGFLGLDNIGPIDRSSTPAGVHLEQSDGTAWMAMYSLNLMRMALILAEQDRAYEDIASKFFEHFCYIASGINSRGLTHGLWDEEDGFYYDVLHREGASIPMRVRSMVGLIVLYAVDVLDHSVLTHLPDFVDRKLWFLEDKVETLDAVPHLEVVGDEKQRLLSIVGPDRLRRILETMLDPSEFLSDHGIRALSRGHLDEPFEVDLGGGFTAAVTYEAAESSSAMFGGNSNWRGPIWFPVNYMLIESLIKFHDFVGEDFKVEHPVGSGQMLTLNEVADDISRRLVSIFTLNSEGRRPVFGGAELFQTEDAWRDMIPFYEYFHGDNGAGIGASHQTGWTGLVADLITTGRGVAANAPKPKGASKRTTKKKAATKA